MFELFEAIPTLLVARPSGSVELELKRVELRDPEGEHVLTVEGSLRVTWDTAPGWVAEPPPAVVDVIPAAAPPPAVVDVIPAAAPPPAPASDTAEPEKKPAKKRTGDRHPAE